VPSPGPGAAKQKHPIRLGNDDVMKVGQVVAKSITISPTQGRALRHEG